MEQRGMQLENRDMPVGRRDVRQDLLSENALIARVCHDLITPFNAISLGMEAFALSKDDDLLVNLQHSINHANVMLKFIRELFSIKSEEFCYINASLGQIVADFLRCYNISFDLQSDFDSIPSIAAKIIMYTAVVMKEIMPYGGKVVTSIDDGSSAIATRGSGRDISIPEMGTTATELNHKNILRHHLMKLLEAYGFEQKVIQDGADVVLLQRIC
jgi:hypothetical protein